MDLLAGRTTVVTGGASGIGFAIAKAFGAQGANVVVGDVDIGRVETAVSELRAGGGGTFEAVRCDVTQEADVDRLLESAINTFSRVDVMVNNAGVTRDATLRTMSLEDLRTVLDVHLVGTWLGIRKASTLMREARSGSIINLSSISGKVGLAGQTNYSAAKAGIVGMTKAAAKEVAHAGVRINAIQPGLIRTPMTESMREDIWQAKLQEVPLGRAGEPGEVASVALFLASDLSSYVTGGRFM